MYVMKINVENKIVIVLAVFLFLCMPMLSPASAMLVKGPSDVAQKSGVDVIQVVDDANLQVPSDEGNPFSKKTQSSNTSHIPGVVWFLSAGGVLIGLVEIRRQIMAERRPLQGRDRLEVLSKEAAAEQAWQARREKGTASSVA